MKKTVFDAVLLWCVSCEIHTERGITMGYYSDVAFAVHQSTYMKMLKEAKHNDDLFEDNEVRNSPGELLDGYVYPIRSIGIDEAAKDYMPEIPYDEEPDDEDDILLPTPTEDDFGSFLNS